MNQRRSPVGQCDAIAGTFGPLMDDVILGNTRADDPLFHAEGLRYLTRMFAAAAVRSEMDDAAYPKFVPAASLWMHWGFANPDAGYHYAKIDGRYTYRFFGRRGTARILDIETWECDFVDISTLHHCSGARHVQLDRTGPISTDGDFEVGPDGEFEVILSTTPQPGNWVRIAEGIGTLILREYFYDWQTEERAQFFVERVGAQYPPPHDTAATLADRMDVIPEFMDRNVRMLAKGIEAQHYSLEPNTMRVQPQHSGEEERGQDDQLALRDIHFLQGRYECGPDDAVILEVADIGTDYWIYYLTSHNWEGGDFHHRQTSLNGHQAELDPDAVFRAIISQRDPGVPNWLDPAGHPNGLILGRYFMPSREIGAPTLTVVPFADLRDHLPASTKVVTPEERSESLRRRMHSVRRRLCEI
jgi:hypothetical protein